MHKQLDQITLAAKGILLITKSPRFWLFFIPSFFFFGLLLRIFATGTTTFSLLFSVSFAQKLQLLKPLLFNLFGINIPLFDWLPLFLLTLLQATLISLTVLIWQKRTKNRPLNSKIIKITKNTPNPEFKNSKIAPEASKTASIERTSLSALLGLLGTGCPSCGTSLIAPLLSSFTTSFALTSTLPFLLTSASVILILYSLKKIGFETYAIIIQENYQLKESHVKNL